MPGQGSRGSPGRFRRLVSGTLLVVVGACVGVVVGTVWNVPELLIERLRRPVEVVELAPDPPAAATDLPEFRSLQRGAPPRPTPGPVAAPPRAAEPRREPQAAREPTAAREPAPASEGVAGVAGAAPAAAPVESAARTLIAEIAERSAAVRPTPAGEVVQVAAYTDARSAEALVRRLQVRGYGAFVSQTVPEGRLRYRVRVRPAAGEDVARLAQELEASGYGVWITRE